MISQPDGTPATTERERTEDDRFPEGAPVFDLYELNAEQLGWYEQFGRPEIIGRREVHYLVEPKGDADPAPLAPGMHLICAFEPVVLIRERLRCLTYGGGVDTLPDDWRVSTAMH